MNTASSKKMLIAVRPVDLQTISNVLGSQFDLVVCYTLEQAISHLDDDIALIVCGVRFDEGSVFQLLTTAKTNPDTALVPFYMIVGEDAKYSPSILEGIRKAALVRGATGFIELAKLTSELGRGKAYEQVRKSVHKILNADSYLGNPVTTFYAGSEEQDSPRSR